MALPNTAPANVPSRGAVVHSTELAYGALPAATPQLRGNGPCLVIRCSVVADLVSVVEFARINRLVAVPAAPSLASGHASAGGDGLLIGLYEQRLPDRDESEATRVVPATAGWLRRRIVPAVMSVAVVLTAALLLPAVVKQYTGGPGEPAQPVQRAQPAPSAAQAEELPELGMPRQNHVSGYEYVVPSSWHLTTRQLPEEGYVIVSGRNAGDAWTLTQHQAPVGPMLALTHLPAAANSEAGAVSATFADRLGGTVARMLGQPTMAYRGEGRFGAFRSAHVVHGDELVSLWLLAPTAAELAELDPLFTAVLAQLRPTARTLHRPRWRLPPDR